MNNGGGAAGDGEADSSGLEDDKEVNLDNFMTLDSVGDVDAEEDEETGDKKKKKEKIDGESGNEPEKKVKNKQMIKVGAEYIKRVEVQFCELCKMYLPRNDNGERAVALHCSTRSHLKRYVRDNDDKALRRQAERIHLQSSSSATVSVISNVTANATENAKVSPASPQQTASVVGTASVANVGNADRTLADGAAKTTVDQKITGSGSTMENNEKNSKASKDGQVDDDEEDDYRGDSGDKLWDDVDKDLGDILRETEPGTKSSDDEDSRYDRFRNSDKKLQQLQIQHAKEKERENDEKVADDKEVNVVKKLEAKVKIEKLEK